MCPRYSYQNDSNENFFICSVPGCSWKIDGFDGEGYCEFHSRYGYEKDCSFIGCDIKINSRRNYCSEHSKVCSEKDCQERITDDLRKSYCYLHDGQCQECSKRIRSGYNGVRFCSQCASKESCQEKGCQASITTQATLLAGNYCSQHSRDCRVIGCSRRVNTNIDYCSNCAINCKNWGCNNWQPRWENQCLVCQGKAERQQEQQRQYQQQQKEQAKETEQNQLKALVKTNTSISGAIQEVERFSPWFNPNCATVIKVDA